MDIIIQKEPLRRGDFEKYYIFCDDLLLGATILSSCISGLSDTVKDKELKYQTANLLRKSGVFAY